MDNHSNRKKTNVVQQAAQKKEFFISEATKEKVKMCKVYISNKYKQMKDDEEEKKMTWQLIMQQMDDLNLTTQEKNGIR